MEDAEMKLEAGATTDGATIQDSHWKPGFTNRFPYLGFGSLVVVLICAVGAVLNLSLSNGVSQSRWPAAIAPNVIISILNSVANLAFGIAISKSSDHLVSALELISRQATALQSLGGGRLYREPPSSSSIARGSSAVV